MIIHVLIFMHNHMCYGFGHSQISIKKCMRCGEDLGCNNWFDSFRRRGFYLCRKCWAKRKKQQRLSKKLLLDHKLNEMDKHCLLEENETQTDDDINNATKSDVEDIREITEQLRYISRKIDETRLQEEKKRINWKDVLVASGITGAVVLVGFGLYNYFNTSYQN